MMNESEINGKDEVIAFCESVLSEQYPVGSDLSHMIGMTIHLATKCYGEGLENDITDAYLSILDRLGFTVVEKPLEALH
jgi:hypothetical protein